MTQLQVQTSGTNAPDGTPEVVASFLLDPASAREAIQLAMKLHRERGGIAAPAVAAMQRGDTDTMRARLLRLQALEAKGIVSVEQASLMRVKVRRSFLPPSRADVGGGRKERAGRAYVPYAPTLI